MAHTIFVPLDMGLIDEGRFVCTANAQLLELQQHLVAFVKLHGLEATKGAKAKLTMEVTLCFEGRAKDDYSVKAQMKKSLPAAPASVNTLLAGETQDGREGLFVRGSGGTEVTPRQLALSTQDGRTVNPDTGKADDQMA